MIRIVLDTNVLISALLSSQGPPTQVLLMILLDSDTQLCVRGAIYAEYEEVARRSCFKRSDSEIEAMLRAIRERGFWIKPTQRVRACSDPDDDIFLVCAQAAAAHYLVTGNTKHFPLTWASARIVTPRQFLDAIS